MSNPIHLTERAVHKAREIASQRGQADPGLRVAAIGGGCSGFKYDVSLDSAPRPGDTVMDFDGLRVFVDHDSLTHLAGMTVDYVESLQSSGFRFLNPNATRTCGCGESFAT